MLAADAGALDHFACKQVQVLTEQRAEAQVSQLTCGQLIEESACRLNGFVAGLGCIHVSDRVHAREREFNRLQIEDQVCTHAGFFHVEIDLVELFMTATRNGLPHDIRLVRCTRRVVVPGNRCSGVNKALGLENEAVKRRVVDRHSAAPLAHGCGETAAGDAR